MGKPLSSLSIMCLAYNEEENLRWALPQLLLLLDEVTDDGEVLIVTSTASTDGTNPYLEELNKKDSRIRFTHQPPGTKGYGPAFAHGMKQLRKEFGFHTDLDGQFDFSELKRAIEVLQSTGADLVHFNRLRRKDPLERKIIGLGFKVLVHGLYKCPVWDFDSAFNLFKTKIVHPITFRSNSGVAVPEFMIKVSQNGAKIVAGRTEHRERRAGKPLWEVKPKWIPIILPNSSIVIANLKDIWRLRGEMNSWLSWGKKLGENT